MSVVETTRALLTLFADSPWRDLHVRVAGEEIFLAKAGGAPNPMRGEASAAKAVPRISVTAPHIATLVSTKDAGTRIAAGGTVAVIELLGELIDVPSPEGGTMLAAEAAPGSLVEYGQPLVSLSAG